MRKKLTEMEKIIIIKDYDRKTPGLIAEELQIRRNTVRSLYRRFLRTHTIINKKQSERPNILTVRQINRIEGFINKKPFTILKEIKIVLNLNCSLRTIAKSLKGLGYRNLRVRRKPTLTQTHKDNRLKWAKKLSNWTFKDHWENVLFSDESSVELWKKYSERQWRKPGESLNEGFFRPKKVDFGKKYAKVWSCFSSKGVGELIFLRDYTNEEEGISRWNKKLYSKLLKENLLREGKKLVGDKFVFQQDNDRVHTSKEVMDWLTSRSIKKTM